VYAWLVVSVLLGVEKGLSDVVGMLGVLSVIEFLLGIVAISYSVLPPTVSEGALGIF
jgi:hypothetical protein